MESFGHKMFISSQPVPLTGTGVMYPQVRDFYYYFYLFIYTNYSVTHPGLAWLGLGWAVTIKFFMVDKAIPN